MSNKPKKTSAVIELKFHWATCFACGAACEFNAKGEIDHPPSKNCTGKNYRLLGPVYAYPVKGKP